MDWEIIGRISDIFGILSVVISFVLWISFRRFKKEIEYQGILYRERRQAIYEKLQELYLTIYKDNIKDRMRISDLRRQNIEIERNYSKYFNKKDRQAHGRIKTMIDIINRQHQGKANIDYEKLNIELDWLITAFSEKGGYN